MFRAVVWGILLSSLLVFTLYWNYLTTGRLHWRYAFTQLCLYCFAVFILLLPLIYLIVEAIFQDVLVWRFIKGWWSYSLLPVLFCISSVIPIHIDSVCVCLLHSLSNAGIFVSSFNLENHSFWALMCGYLICFSFSN